MPHSWYYHIMAKVKVKWSCLVVSDSLWPHGILQARILEWLAISFSRGSSWPRDWTQVSRIAGRCFNLFATREAHILWQGLDYIHCCEWFLARYLRSEYPKSYSKGLLTPDFLYYYYYHINVTLVSWSKWNILFGIIPLNSVVFLWKDHIA